MLHDSETGPPGSGPSPLEGRLRSFLLFCVALTLVLGAAKVFLQKADPPSWVIPEQNMYQGYVAIDRYAYRAELIRDWILGEVGGGERLSEEFTTYGHSTSLLGPAVVALFSLVTTSVPIGFVVASSVATVLQVLLVVALANTLVDRRSRATGLVAGLLAAAHLTMIRTSGQLHSDPIMAAVACAAVLGSLRWLRRPGPGTGIALFLIQVCGSFTKLSFLPFLGAPALIALVTPSERKGRNVGLGVLLFGIAPVIPALLFVGLFAGQERVTGDLGQVLAFRSHWEALVIELVLLLQLLPLILLLRPRPHGAARGVVLLAFASILFVAATGLPDHRLYLAAVGPLAAAAAPTLTGRFSPRALWLFLLGYAALNYGLGIAALLR